MKILYISSAQMPDYQCDMLFHGLKEIAGDDIVDINRLWFMYADDFADGRNKKQDLYGKGFSIYGLLPSDQKVDRDDLTTKIRLKYYDLIIFGNICRCEMLLDQALRYYQPSRLIFIDGEDRPALRQRVLGRGLYFKRELQRRRADVLPINFAIPGCNIRKDQSEKTKLLAFSDPRDRTTYIYDNQDDYYADYATSRFAITTKKAGWDALRHYEIIANQCIPLFLDIENCPAATLTRFPKDAVWQARCRFDRLGGEFFATPEGHAEWHRLFEPIGAEFGKTCTTDALARYVLDMATRQGSQPMGRPGPAARLRRTLANWRARLTAPSG